MTRIGALLLGLAACGDNNTPETCINLFRELSEYGQPLPGPTISTDCHAALVFAARDTSTLMPAQDEIDRYFERWTRAIAAEPILDRRVPQSRRNIANSVQAEIRTSNPLIIGAWTLDDRKYRPPPPTGDAVFDNIVAELVGPQLHGSSGGSTTREFYVRTRAVFNEEVLHAQLLETSSHLPDAIQEYKDDGNWTWDDGSRVGSDDATAQIDFQFGWGDCFVGCLWMHYLRAVVPPTGRPIVYDMGGDPLEPFGMMLSPDTLPPPE